MFDIIVENHFSAGHHLRNYPGNCERPHGHNWKIKITIRATALDELGMAVDFRVAKNALKEIMDDLDHRDLNEHPNFLDKNPSSENIAIYIFRGLQEKLTADRYRPYAVEVRETDSCGVVYHEND
ncbi:MAG: 6-carboxytetrahydropterin synthase QueD [Proteobacteria bacterium]|nr:6-carboxytetrahydropterin synthase QueD [Pseudomonadota bacterium]MBU1688340.1 6-carboxytetrahydropterin synthase QueD [Pseudomonadota bacterium]